MTFQMYTFSCWLSIFSITWHFQTTTKKMSSYYGLCSIKEFQTLKSKFMLILLSICKKQYFPDACYIYYSLWNMLWCLCQNIIILSISLWVHTRFWQFFYRSTHIIAARPSIFHLFTLYFLNVNIEELIMVIIKWGTVELI